MNEIIKKLQEAYPMGTIIDIERLTSGNSSQAQLVKTQERHYILRQLMSNDQAEAEYEVTRRLAGTHISPEILLTKNGEPCIQVGKFVYNLQVFLPNEVNHDQGIDYSYLGRVIGLFHKQISDMNPSLGQPDRFNLIKEWTKLKETNVGLPKQVVDLINDAIENQLPVTGYIHGDLGKWNLLFNHNRIYIIDFGEVRRGNLHFDIAAIMLTTFNWQLPDVHLINQLRSFAEGYLLTNQPIIWSQLMMSINLWIARGIVVIINQFGQTNDVDDYIKAELSKQIRILQLINTLKNEQSVI